MAAVYPPAGKAVDGLRVINKIEIPDSDPSWPVYLAKLDIFFYAVMEGFRKVPVKDFPNTPKQLMMTKDGVRAAHFVAHQIQSSRSISPLLVIVDSDGPYLLGGTMPFDDEVVCVALKMLGVRHFPAMVVLDDN